MNTEAIDVLLKSLSQNLFIFKKNLNIFKKIITSVPAKIKIMITNRAKISWSGITFCIASPIELDNFDTFCAKIHFKFIACLKDAQ